MVTYAQRLKSHPDLPTFKEQGIDVTYEFRVGLTGPKGIPADRVKIINDAYEKALKDPATVKKLEDLGFDVDFMNQAALKSWFAKFAGGLEALREGSLYEEIGFDRRPSGKEEGRRSFLSAIEGNEMKKDIVIGLVTMAISAACLISLSNMKQGFAMADNVSASFFPYVMVGLLGFLGVLQTTNAFAALLKARKDAGRKSGKTDWEKSWKRYQVPFLMFFSWSRHTFS